MTTAPTGSYVATEEHRDLESELARLQAQVEIGWAQEARLLRRAGLRDGMAVLEMGCGPGFVLAALQREWPGLCLTGLDNDAALLARAEVHLDGAVTVVHADAANSGLPANRFDVVIARYLFQHLADPAGVAAEAHRVLKPGGTLVAIDVDDMLWGLVEPAFPRLSAIFARAAQAQSGRGGNRFVGRRLWRILSRAGFVHPRLDAFVTHSDDLGLDPFLPQMDPDRLLVAVRSQAITWEEYWTARDLYQRFLAAPDPFVLMAGLCAYGQKPTIAEKSDFSSAGE